MAVTLEDRVSILEQAVSAEIRERKKMHENIIEVKSLLDDRSKAHKRLLQSVGETQSEHSATLRDIRDKVDGMAPKVDSIETQMHGMQLRMTHLDTKMDSVGSRMGRIETRMTHLDTRMDSVGSRMGRIETRMDSIETQMDSIDTRMDSVGTKVGQLDTKVGQLDTKVGRLDTKVGRLDGKIDEVIALLNTGK